MITNKQLRDLGFKDSGKRHGKSIVWQKPINDYPTTRYFIFIKGNYSPTNPNIGTLGIYTPVENVPAVPEDLAQKDIWTKEDQERAANYTIEYGGDTIYFAYYLDDVARLERLIKDISFER